MMTNIIHSGSDGNCVVITDKEENQVVLDCGINYELILPYIKLRSLNALLVTHVHKDHSKSLKQFQRIGINCITWENVKDGELIELAHWKILPMKLIHNAPCFGFLIYSKVENKKFAYITDTTYIPKLGKNIDCLILDTNYSQQIVNDLVMKGVQVGIGYRNHLSLEQAKEYLENLNYKIPNFVAYHISNSGLNNVETIEKELSSLVGRIIISKPHTEFEF